MPQLPPPAKKVSEDLLQMEKNSDRRRSAICFVFNDEGVRRYLSRNKRNTTVALHAVTSRQFLLPYIDCDCRKSSWPERGRTFVLTDTGGGVGAIFERETRWYFPIIPTVRWV